MYEPLQQSPYYKACPLRQSTFKNRTEPCKHNQLLLQQNTTPSETRKSRNELMPPQTHSGLGWRSNPKPCTASTALVSISSNNTSNPTTLQDKIGLIHTIKYRGTKRHPHQTHGKCDSRPQTFCYLPGDRQPNNQQGPSGAPLGLVHSSSRQEHRQHATKRTSFPS